MGQAKWVTMQSVRSGLMLPGLKMQSLRRVFFAEELKYRRPGQGLADLTTPEGMAQN